MPKLKFNAVKMSDAHVSHISLVERGANRIPFKVIKQENHMSQFAGIDLGNLFGTRKSEAKAPEVVAVVTMKGEGFESIKKQVEEAGFAVSDVKEMEDGSMVFKQGEGEFEDGTVIRLNDDIAIVTKGFSPYNMDVSAGDVSFADQCAAKGFYPGVDAIMNTLSDAVRNITYNAKDPNEAKVAVTKLFSEASAYVAAFVGSLPVKAFKLETCYAEAPAPVAKADLPNGDGVTDEVTEEMVTKAALTAEEKKYFATLSGKDKFAFIKATPEARSKMMEDAADGDKDDSTGGASGAKKGEAADPAAPAPAADPAHAAPAADPVQSKDMEVVMKSMADIAGRLDKFSGAFEGVQKSIKDINESLASASQRLDAAEKVAKAAKDAVAGAVVSGADGGDAGVVSTQKSEGGCFGGRDIDTAYMPGLRNRR